MTPSPSSSSDSRRNRKKGPKKPPKPGSPGFRDLRNKKIIELTEKYPGAIARIMIQSLFKQHPNKSANELEQMWDGDPKYLELSQKYPSDTAPQQVIEMWKTVCAQHPNPSAKYVGETWDGVCTAYEQEKEKERRRRRSGGVVGTPNSSGVARRATLDGSGTPARGKRRHDDSLEDDMGDDTLEVPLDIGTGHRRRSAGGGKRRSASGTPHRRTPVGRRVSKYESQMVSNVAEANANMVTSSVERLGQTLTAVAELNNNMALRAMNEPNEEDEEYQQDHYLQDESFDTDGEEPAMASMFNKSNVNESIDLPPHQSRIDDTMDLDLDDGSSPKRSRDDFEYGSSPLQGSPTNHHVAKDKDVEVMGSEVEVASFAATAEPSGGASQTNAKQKPPPPSVEMNSVESPLATPQASQLQQQQRQQLESKDPAVGMKSPMLSPIQKEPSPSSSENAETSEKAEKAETSRTVEGTAKVAGMAVGMPKPKPPPPSPPLSPSKLQHPSQGMPGAPPSSPGSPEQRSTGSPKTRSPPEHGSTGPLPEQRSTGSNGSPEQRSPKQRWTGSTGSPEHGSTGTPEQRSPKQRSTGSPERGSPQQRMPSPMPPPRQYSLATIQEENEDGSFVEASEQNGMKSLEQHGMKSPFLSPIQKGNKDDAIVVESMSIENATGRDSPRQESAAEDSNQAVDPSQANQVIGRDSPRQESAAEDSNQAVDHSQANQVIGHDSTRQESAAQGSNNEHAAGRRIVRAKRPEKNRLDVPEESQPTVGANETSSNSILPSALWTSNLPYVAGPDLSHWDEKPVPDFGKHQRMFLFASKKLEDQGVDSFYKNTCEHYDKQSNDFKQLYAAYGLPEPLNTELRHGSSLAKGHLEKHLRLSRCVPIWDGFERARAPRDCPPNPKLYEIRGDHKRKRQKLMHNPPQGLFLTEVPPGHLYNFWEAPCNSQDCLSDGEDQYSEKDAEEGEELLDGRKDDWRKDEWFRREKRKVSFSHSPSNDSSVVDNVNVTNAKTTTSNQKKISNSPATDVTPMSSKDGEKEPSVAGIEKESPSLNADSLEEPTKNSPATDVTHLTPKDREKHGEMEHSVAGIEKESPSKPSSNAFDVPLPSNAGSLKGSLKEPASTKNSVTVGVAPLTSATRKISPSKPSSNTSIEAPIAKKNLPAVDAPSPSNLSTVVDDNVTNAKKSPPEAVSKDLDTEMPTKKAIDFKRLAEGQKILIKKDSIEKEVTFSHITTTTTGVLRIYYKPKVGKKTFVLPDKVIKVLTTESADSSTATASGDASDASTGSGDAS